MRSPTDVLSHLHGKAQDKTYRFQRLYRNLYNPEFYLLAYRNIYANDGSMTPGVDGTTMDGMGAKRVARIITALRSESYQPRPARRTYIEKQNNSKKKRPLGILSGDDKLVQEVVRMLLESIYEPVFSQHSHGFRPNKSCHTALLELQYTGTGSNWFIEGDITACFDSFEHHTLIELLRRRIDDEKFIALMWKFLKAGYMEQWRYYDTFTGTPQGSGMSPILANIYLHELDTFLEEYQTSCAAGNSKQRKVNPEYSRAASVAQRYKARLEPIWEQLSAEERKHHAKALRALKMETRTIPSRKFRDTSFKKIEFVRYADDFLVCLTGSKADALHLKAELNAFLSSKLHLTLSEEKTKITHTSGCARFLGYDITVTRSQDTKRDKNGNARRVHSGNVLLYVPHEKWASKLIAYKAIRVAKDKNGKDHYRALHRKELICRPDIDILRKYDAEVRGMYEYYSIANNASVIGHFGSLMKWSMLKTFAAKYRTKTKDIKERYMINGKFTVSYKTKAGMKQAGFYSGGYERKKRPSPWVDTPIITRAYTKGMQLSGRIRAGICELCGATCDVEMHQVKKLKNLKGRLLWEQVMISKRRKTLAVCPKCHDNIHLSKG